LAWTAGSLSLSKTAFLFPGQGSQYVGMGSVLYSAYPVAKETYAEASDTLGYDMAKLCFEGPSEKLNQTEYTQPAILATSISAWRALGITTESAVAVAGHSLGEYTALVVAEAISFCDALLIVSQRGRFMQEAVPAGEGGMAAIIGLTGKEVEAICESLQEVYPANYNAPDQIVIAGKQENLKKAMAMAEEKGAKRVIPIAVSVPSHSPLMLPACKRLESVLETISGKNLKIPLINNKDAKVITLWSEARASLVTQLAYPLLWDQSIQMMRTMGADLFIEIGPSRVLSGLLKRMDRSLQVMSVESEEGIEKVRGVA
jgi:[acyl-carrier-protein] S-malonyltransferase